MNVTDLRAVVWTQTQTTSGELAETTIDLYLRQAFERTVNAEVKWPFYETAWNLDLQVNQFTITLPGDVNVPGIMALIDMQTGVRLQQVSQEWAEDHFYERASWDDSIPGWVTDNAVTNQPWYSIWGDVITLWPIAVPAENRKFSLRGYRKSLAWLTANQEPDCDPRLHLPLTHYAVALAYAQQEDEQLEAVYMERWMRDVELAHTQIMAPRHHQPLVMSGSIDTIPLSGATWVLTPP